MAARKAKPITTLAELDERFADQARIGWSLVGQAYNSEALTFIAHQLDGIAKALSRNGRPKRPASAWQRFFADGMKAGKSPAEIGAAWRSRG